MSLQLPSGIALALATCTGMSGVTACDAVLPRFRIDAKPTPAETLTVIGAPNVFTAASAHAGTPAPVDVADSVTTPPSWSIGDRRIAVVNQSGMVVGGAPGTTIVTASLAGRWTFTAVNVLPATLPKVRIIAHRGFMQRFPENTIVAVRNAFDVGADAVEVDIRLSADAVPVVMHDETVDRTTDGHGAVSALTAAQLATLNACVRWADTPRCAVPLMTDVLREAHGRGGIVLHLYGRYTANDLEKLLGAVRDADMDRQAIFACFDYPVLAALRRLDPVVALGYLSYHAPDSKLIGALGRAAPIVELKAAIADSTAMRTYFVAASQRRQELAAWTALSQTQAQQAVALGFRTILADVPIDRSTLGP